MKKTFKILSIILITLLLCSNFAFGATTSKYDATMKLVEDNVCNITFGKYGEFEKKLIKCDTESKTVDISLTVKNNAEKLENKDAEVVLLIDSSRSMSTNTVTINGQSMTRKEAVLASAQKLIDKLFNANPNIKIGIVQFATSTEVDENGYTIEGTDKDAEIVTDKLSNDKKYLTSSLDKVSETTMGPRTNLEVGLDAAYTLLKTSTNTETEKYIITLTDAIPNTARGVTMDTYSDKSIVPTQNKLQELKEKNVNLISVLIEMSDNEIEISKEDPKPTYREVAERIFGTSTTPKAGTVYYVNANQVEDTITNQIYNSLVQESYVLNNIVIKDYFPKNIIDNFTYAELVENNLGDISAEVNKADNSITWTIPTLEPGEIGTFSYRLSLNETFNSEIIGINLPTNENVTIDYEENNVPGKEENDKCPIIALDVLPKKDIPQTGNYTGLYITLIVGSVALISIVSLKSFRKNKF